MEPRGLTRRIVGWLGRGYGRGIGTATDGGGSIRIPAAWSGLVGLKPTNGVIGREPIPGWIDLSTFGPLAQTVADARLLLSIEASPIPSHPSAIPFAPLMRRDRVALALTVVGFNLMVDELSDWLDPRACGARCRRADGRAR